MSALHLCPYPATARGAKLHAGSFWSVQIEGDGDSRLVVRTGVGRVELWLHTRVPGLCTPAAANVGTCRKGSSSIPEQGQWGVMIFRS